MNTITMRPAKTADDVETVVAMWNRAAAWLAEQGSDQWQYPVKRHNIEAKCAAGHLWLAEAEDGRAVATVTVDEDADPELWPPEDSPDDALYVHRLVVDAAVRGAEIGSAILDWVAARAQREGKNWIRLDAWTTNPKLHKYYTDRGFALVRVLGGRQHVSGALLQRRAAERRGSGPRIVDDSPTDSAPH